ncbi:MAG: release factor glutamine methyltransferase, partial [Thermodesulfobacteriota bacterium]|nr:release factor glutamine methyltransferase [Thermodesulfobacteriota bacterium]
IETLEPEIKFFEPLSSLDGGMDGLDFIRKIGRDAGRFLKPQGVLALEVGDGQSAMVSEILSNSFSIESVSVMKDLAGKDRVVMGFR